MTHKFSFSLFVFLALILAACTSTQTPTTLSPVDSDNDASTQPKPAATSGEMTRTDAQGAVEFVVEPLNLNAPGDTLEFMVTMDTHSVELSWDLAAQSVLTTNTGLEVVGLSWSGGVGHHVEGTLVFPTQTAEGQSLVEGVKTLTLMIRGAGANERVFVWEVLP